MPETGCSGLMHWDDPEGWGTHVYPWLIRVNVWQKPPQYGKVISLQLKFKKYIKKKKEISKHYIVLQELT